MYDGIEFRGYLQKTVELLAEHSGVPVWNGLTDDYHPTQVLADIMTMRENTTKSIHEMKLVFVGDARNNVANSLMIVCAKLGMKYAALAPKELFPDEKLVAEMRELCKTTGGEIIVTEQMQEAVKDADALYTDVWVSMGEAINSRNGSVF
jgi:ornithine carbamoyltransferase